MSNIPQENRLDIRLSPKQREWLEAFLLPCDTWEQREEEMPPECHDVVTGDAFYCGCEGIGYTEKTGWYLVLWEPDDDDEPLPEPVPLGDSGLSLLRSDVCPNSGPSHLTLLFMQNRSEIIRQGPGE